MYKVIGVLKRPEGMTFDEFQTWWFEEHAPKVKLWPGLKAYNINIAVNENELFDGVAEVWFHTKEDATQVFSTPEGRAAHHSATEGAGNSAIFIVQEHVVVEG